jgi:NADPH:quinone reductase-like Zn-dependent oxidoreductase
MESVAVPSSLKADQVLVKMIAAPITEFDGSIIAGFGAKRMGTVLPATGGSEGFGVVQGVGPSVKDLKEGDYVVPTVAGVGTWATHTVAAASDLAVVAPAAMKDGAGAAVIASSVGACSLAKCLLQMGRVKEGDLVVQTNAHSPVAHVIAQMAAEHGIAVVNILPDHPESESLTQHLNALNPAGFTVSERTARTPAFAKLLKDLPPAALAIDGAGGSAAISAASALRSGGLLLSYGNSSHKPLTLPMGVLLEKGIIVRGFNLDGWAREVGAKARRDLAASSAAAAASGKYTQLLTEEPFADWSVALSRAAHPFERKVVLRFD